MSKNPILSIIVTAHNCEAYLDKCLQSIIKFAGEKFESLEIILIDDSSVDRTNEMCRDFSENRGNVMFYRVDFKNIGKVRNFAMKQCTGEYITMIDGDDEVSSNAFSDIALILTENKPDILLTRLNEIYISSTPDNKWTGLTVSPISQHKAIIKFLIHREVQAHFIGQFFRRDILEGMQFPELRCYEDAYLFPSVLTKASSILISPNSHYFYFKRSGSLSSHVDYEKVSMLIKATEQMTVAFGELYENLIACHWINIQHKHKAAIRDDSDKKLVKECLKNISFLPFLFDPKVRMSFKKKYLKLYFSGAF